MGFNLDRLSPLASVLNNGNTTGAFDIVVSTGQKITGQTNLTLDAVAVLELGAATATSVTLGRTGITVTIPGNLVVSGTTTTISTTNLVVTDALIYGNNGGVADSPTGIAWDQGIEDDAILLFNGVAGRFETGRVNTTGGTVVPANLSVFSDLKVSNLLLAGTAITADAGLTVTATAATLNLAATGANIVTVTTSATERLRVDSAGNVRISPGGVASPSVPDGRLNVLTESAVALVKLQSSHASTSPIVSVYRSRGTISSPTSVAADDDLFNIGFLGYQSGAGGDGMQHYGSITVAVDGTPSNGSAPGRISLWTTPSGSGGTIERWRIQNTGALTGRSAGSQLTWTTGLGSITHILGPTDQDLVLRAGAIAGAGAGRSLYFYGGVPTDGDGGLVAMVGANGVGTNKIGGSCYMEPGAGTNAQGGGYSFIRGGQGGPTNGVGGHVQICPGLGGTAAAAGGIIDIQTASAGAGTTRTTRWQFVSDGHFRTVADNAYDIGAAGATRPRTIYVGTSIVIDSSPSQLVLDGLTGDGQSRDTLISSVGGNLNLVAPAGEWIWIGGTELAVQEVYIGAYNGASYTAIQGGSDGIELLTDNDGPINLAVSNAPIHISLGGTIPGGDGFLVNCNGSVKMFAANGMELLATSGSNTITAATNLGLGAGTAINIGTTGTPAINIGGAGATVNISDVGNVNGKAGTSLFITPNLGLVLELRGGQPANATASGGALNVTSGPGGATSGNSGDVNLRSGAVVSGTPGNLNLGVNNTNYWRVNASGHFIAVTDNTHDIGAVGATRPRRVYVATEVVVGSTVTISTAAVTGSGALTVTATAATLSLAATGANDITFSTSATERLKITGTGGVAIGGGVLAASEILNITGDVTRHSIAITAGAAGAIYLAAGSGLTEAGVVAGASANLYYGADSYIDCNSAGVDIGATGVGKNVTIGADGTFQVNGAGGAYIELAPTIGLDIQADNGGYLQISATDARLGYGAGEIIVAPSGDITVVGVLTGPRTVYEIHGSDDTLAASESGSTHANSGAATRTLILPTVAVAGVRFSFVSLVSGQVLRIDPGAAEKFVGLAGGWVDGEYAEIAANGAMEIVSQADGDWAVTYTRGTITEETP